VTRYRMRVYRSGHQLWRTHDIWAKDDADAKYSAQQKFNDLSAELAGQKCPLIADPTPERFDLYEGSRLVC